VVGDCVVGWCDIIPIDREGFEHSGRMGMGVLAEYRGQGIGHELATRAIEHAREAGLERVELGVFTSNTRAIRLYEQLGFVTEGIKRRSRRCDGIYYDLAYMALFLQPG
jgi:L-phenylalanine/L-methionine N-acetyltransferase